MLQEKQTKTSWISSLKNFLYTYREAVKISWNVRKDLLIGTTVANTISGLLLLPKLYVSKNIIDLVVNSVKTGDYGNSIARLIILISIQLLLSIIQTIDNRFDWVFVQTLTRYVQVTVQNNINAKLTTLPITTSENPEYRDLYKRVYDRSGSSTWGLIMPLSALPYAVFTIISSVIVLSSQNPIFIPLALILAIPEYFVASRNTKEAYKFDKEYQSKWRIANAYEEFTTKGRYLYENKILGNSQFLLGEFMSMVKGYFGKRYDLWFTFGKRRVIVSIPSDVVAATLQGYLYLQAIIGKITIGSAQIQVSALDNLVNNISGLTKQANEIIENYMYVADYNKFMGLEEENLIKGEEVSTPFVNGIEFRNVWFKYPQNNRYTLKGVSFKVNTTDNIAIVGKNGAGKTTIIKLLCRFYEPQKGEILVNGKNIKDYSVMGYRRVISALFQEFAQYPFSAKANIGYGDIKRIKDDDAIKKAAHLTGVGDFIENLPLGYDNPLDNEFEHGIEPSKGQWQRIALARALFRKAEIFILDEPTSNVDPEAEEEIFEKIITLAKEKIVFLISHRFSTVKKADKILLLDKGVVAEYGSHTELMKNKGEYSKLFILQAKAYQDERHS